MKTPMRFQLIIFLFLLSGLIISVWPTLVTAQNADVAGLWSLDAHGISTGCTEHTPGGIGICGSFEMGDADINVSQAGTTISASGVDINNNPFTLSGSVSGSLVSFIISGIGITPGVGPATTTYNGILSGDIIGGDFSGSASWSYRDANGNLVTETATWAGTFAVKLQQTGIIVHVHNPEGVEIASVQGMSQNSVEIYDGNTLIGYGAHSAQTHNRPIRISAGAHIIKANFNGMTKEQTLTLNLGETKVVTFTFERTEFDFLNYISSQFNCRLISQIDGSYNGVQAYLDDSKTCGSWSTHTAHESVHADTYGTYSLYADLLFNLADNAIRWKIEADADKTNSVRGAVHICHSRWHASAYMPLNSRELDLPLKDYRQWYLQYSNCSIQNTLSIKVGGASLVEGDYQLEIVEPGIIPVSIENIQSPSVEATGLTCKQENDGITWHHWGTFQAAGQGEINVKMSSVPYDLTGTGIKDGGSQPPSPPTVDLSIEKVRIGQVVYDSDIDRDSKIDLVQDKEVALFVTVQANGFNGNTDVLIVAKLGDRFIGSEIVSMSNTGPEGREIPLFFTPWDPGDYMLVVEIDPQNLVPEIDESNNRIEKNVKVRATKLLGIPYVLIPRCNSNSGTCYEKLKEANEHFLRSSSFIKTTYPLSDYGFNSHIAKKEVIGNWEPGEKGQLSDARAVYLAGKLSMSYGKRAVGIVPRDYFLYHSLLDPDSKDAVGISFHNVFGVLTTEGYWTSPAHEIAHQLGFKKDEYNNKDDGIPVEGYWCGEKVPITKENALGFMGTGSYHPLLNPADPPQWWISTDTWDTLFTRLDARSAEPDPEILLISGTIDKNGLMEILPWYRISEGTPDFPEPGPYTIRVINKNGETLLSVPFDLVFKKWVEPLGYVDSNVTGFAFAIPYPLEAAKINIEDTDGTPIFEIEPNGKLLRDAIEALPDNCFIKNASQLSKALVNKTDALEKIIDSGNTVEAISKLRDDIRKQAENWLVNNCGVTDALATTKTDLLRLVDHTILRLSVR